MAGHGRAYAQRVVGVAWAFSAWTKASLLLGAARPPFRRLPNDDKRYFAVYHLCIAYATLTYVRRRQEVRADDGLQMHDSASRRPLRLRFSPAQSSPAATLPGLH